MLERQVVFWGKIIFLLKVNILTGAATLLSGQFLYFFFKKINCQDTNIKICE